MEKVLFKLYAKTKDQQEHYCQDFWFETDSLEQYDDDPTGAKLRRDGLAYALTQPDAISKMETSGMVIIGEFSCVISDLAGYRIEFVQSVRDTQGE